MAYNHFVIAYRLSILLCSLLYFQYKSGFIFMFNSILFKNSYSSLSNDKPSIFKDLNLDQVFSPIISDNSDYDISSYFYTTLKTKEDILYRQNVLKDLDNKDVFTLFDTFSKTIYKLQTDIKNYKDSFTNHEKEYSSYISQGHMLHYASIYTSSINTLLEEVKKTSITSLALLSFIEYLKSYISSSFFISFNEETKKVRDAFDNLEYCLFIKNGVIKVRKYTNEKDNKENAYELFGKFIEEDSKNYLQTFPDRPHSEHIENKILTLLEKIYPKEFSLLTKYFTSFIDFVDEKVSLFAKEMRFYIAWINYVNKIKDYGLSFTYPTIVSNKEECYAYSFFDLALAQKIKREIVTNDFNLQNDEKLIVITGPNQGGKTTFARSFGHLFYLSSLGLSVPGTKASLPLVDNIFTHFEREESFTTKMGKLQDDIERLHTILKHATENSVVIINEIYSSTTLSDALSLGSLMMDDLSSLKAYGVIVTFMDELAEHGKETVSMMSNVKEDGSNERTFKIIRRPPDGIAHALFIAQKYKLTYEDINGRLSK